MHKRRLLASIAIAVAFAVVPARGMMGVLHPESLHLMEEQNKFFDYWNRCIDHRYEPERRLSYCKSILRDGRHSQLAVLTEIGDAYFALRKYPDAVTNFAEALNHQDVDVSANIDEYRTDAIEGLEEALVLSGRFDSAMDHVNTRIKDRSNASEPYTERCWLRAIAGQNLDSALQDCNEALIRTPDDARTLGTRGLVNFKLGKPNEANADFDAALQKNDKVAGWLYMRGILKSRNGHSEEADEDIAAAKKLNPIVAEHYTDYGVTPSIIAAKKSAATIPVGNAATPPHPELPVRLRCIIAETGGLKGIQR